MKKYIFTQHLDGVNDQYDDFCTNCFLHEIILELKYSLET